MKVENTSIVITGAGSSIGAALAEQLAAMGANLALVDLRTDRLEPLAEKLKQSNNRTISSLFTALTLAMLKL